MVKRKRNKKSVEQDSFKITDWSGNEVILSNNELDRFVDEWFAEGKRVIEKCDDFWSDEYWSALWNLDQIVLCGRDKDLDRLMGHCSDSRILGEIARYSERERDLNILGMHGDAIIDHNLAIHGREEDLRIIAGNTRNPYTKIEIMKSGGEEFVKYFLDDRSKLVRDFATERVGELGYDNIDEFRDKVILQDCYII